MIINKKQYGIHKMEGDGFCTLCKEIAWSAADPKQQYGYCSNCENRSSVVGIDVALELNLVTLEGYEDA